MRTILLILLLAWCISCKKDVPCALPDPLPPYGMPDDRVVGDLFDGARLLIYAYNCLDSQYVIVRYYRPDLCSDYDTLEIRGQCSDK